MRRFRFLLAGALCLGLAAAAKAQQYPDPAEAVRLSGEISELLLRRDIGQAVGKAAPSTPIAADALNNAFSQVLKLGNGQYADLIYSRLYGRTEQDIIYKVQYAGTVLFIRYLFQVEGGRWRLFNFALKTDTDAPFPKDWPHIYPK